LHLSCDNTGMFAARSIVAVLMNPPRDVARALLSQPFCVPGLNPAL